MIAFRRWKRNSYSEFFRVIEVDGLDHPVPITRRTSIEPGRGSGGFKLVAADLTVAVIKGGRHIVILQAAMVHKSCNMDSMACRWVG